MNNFILSGEGFFKSETLNTTTKEKEIEWTKLLREAKRFNTKTAKATIKRNNIDGFIWNPYKEEPIKGKWEVIQRSKEYCFFHNEEHKSLEWRPVRVKMENKTDVKYLTSNGVTNNIYYNSYEEALIISQEKNLEIINELQDKMIKIIESKGNY